MNLEAMAPLMGRSDFWRQVQIHPRLSSTADALKSLAEGGAAEGTALIGLELTAARGRAGRAWSAPRGGLWLSALLRPPMAIEQAGCIAVLTAVSLAQALRARYGIAAGIKWPNDIWVHGRKLAGILAELSTRAGQLQWLNLGIGLNVNNPLPVQARVEPTSLQQELGREIPLDEVAVCALEALADGYRRFLSHGFAPFVEEWEQLSVLEGMIRFERHGVLMKGNVMGLDDGGRLLVRTDRGVERLAAEEVHVRSAQGSPS